MICPQIDTLFFGSILKIFKSEIFIQTLISRLTVNKNVISIYQNLSLGVYSQKQEELEIEPVAIV